MKESKILALVCASAITGLFGVKYIALGGGSGLSGGVVFAADLALTPQDQNEEPVSSSVDFDLLTGELRGTEDPATSTHRRSIQAESIRLVEVAELEVPATSSAAPTVASWQVNLAKANTATEDGERGDSLLKLIGRDAPVEEVRGALLNARYDDSAKVRMAAIATMTSLDHEGFSGQIEQALDDPDGLVRDAALYALGEANDWDGISSQARLRLTEMVEQASSKTEVVQLARTFEWVQEPFFQETIKTSKRRLGYVDEFGTVL